MLKDKLRAGLLKGGSFVAKWAPVVVTCASAIAAVTPSPSDDSFWVLIHQLIDIIALNVGHSSPS